MMLNTQRKNIMPNPTCYVKLHRVIWKNDKGDLHRDDGPAIEHADSTTYWYLNNFYYSEKDYNAKIKTLR